MCIRDRIGIDDDAVIEPLKSDFRHRIAVYGSSFTQGVSTDRSGMSYPMQFMSNTGLQVVSLATSGRCLMQPYMLDVLAEVKADAFIFDTFSNPDAEPVSYTHLRIPPSIFVADLQVIDLCKLRDVHDGSFQRRNVLFRPLFQHDYN